MGTNLANKTKMEHLSNQQVACPSREAAKRMLVRYSVISYMMGFATGATVFAILCLANVHAAREMLGGQHDSGNLSQALFLEKCLSTFSAS